MTIRHLLIASLIASGLTLSAAEGVAPAAAKPYPIDVCLMMDEKIDPTLPVEVYQGQEFKFCCKGCIKKFKKNPDKYAAMLKERVEQQPKK